jgi:hypothetical protein
MGAPTMMSCAAKVARRMTESGIDLPHAVLACALVEAPAPCELTERMLTGTLDPTVAEHRWAADLARRLGLGG